jgi:DNA-binding IclR family transcriptional regulator
MYQAFPYYATASGKLFLHYLPKEQRETILNRIEFKAFTPQTMTNKDQFLESLKQIDQAGYAVENEEIGRGVSAIAVPILTFNNTLFGTISITAFTSINQNVPKHAIPAMHRVARHIAQRVEPLRK